MIQLDWDIPSSCQECRFSVDGWCYAIRAEDSQPSELCYLTRPEWCPLRDAAPRWHRVEDGLPEKGTWVLTIAKELNVTIFNIATVDAGGQWWTTSPHKIMRELYGVRYWMPIEPPKEDNDG